LKDANHAVNDEIAIPFWLLNGVLAVVLFASFAEGVNKKTRPFMSNNNLSVLYENQN